jgi:hypothetical protein
MNSSKIRLVCIDSNKKVLYAVKEGKWWCLESPPRKGIEFRGTRFMESKYLDEMMAKKI